MLLLNCSPKNKRSNTVRNVLMSGVALSAVMGVSVSAQDKADSEMVLFDEILVTAQRRAERIEDVPISVAAFGQDALDNMGIDSSDKLQFATPGIVNTATAGDGISTIFIRGVGTGYSGPGLESSVAMYLDDVYLQTQTSAGQMTVDVSNVQVLKGPQGTLYGRNATGGAVIVTTNDPVIGEFEGYAQVGYGNLNWMRGEAVVNVPVSETFALRFAGFYETRDGYVENTALENFEKSGVGSGKRGSARVKALWQPSDDLRLVAKFAYDRANGNGAIHSLQFNPDGTPTDVGFYETTQGAKLEGGGGDDTDAVAGSLRLEYDFENWTLSNTFGYRETRAFGCTDNDGLVADIVTFCTVSQRSPNAGTADGKKDKTITNEIRLVSELDGPFNVTAGGFYERNKARFFGRVIGSAFGGAVLDFDNFNNLTAYSAYIDGSYQVTDAFKISGGLRYTHETKYHGVDQLYLLAFGAPSSNFVEDETSFSDVSPRIVFSYDAGAMNYYASYNSGFKSGGYNSPAFGIDPILDPETIDAFEVGAKYLSDDGTLSLSTAAFYYDWKDIQVAFITGGGVGIQQQNAAGAENYGAEMNLDWRPTANLRVQTGVAYTHARFTDFANAAVYNLNDSGLLSATAEDLEGFRVPHAPDLTINGAIIYVFNMDNDWTGDVTIAGHYASEYDFVPGAGGELRASRQDALATFNLSGRFITPSEMLEIGWFVHNLTDEKQIELINTGDNGVYMKPGEPRTFGVTMRVRFQ